MNNEKIRVLDPEKDRELIEAIKLKEKDLDQVSGGKEPEEEGVTCPNCGSDNIVYIGTLYGFNEKFFVCNHCWTRFRIRN